MSLMLALLVAASIAAPVSAAYRPPVMTWQPKTNVIKANNLSALKPSSPGSTGTVEKPQTPETPSTTPAAPTAPSYPSVGSASTVERQVVELVNRQRAAYGLKSLTWNSALASGALLKARDLQQNRYFDHNSPTYGSPFNMMRSLGITYRSAGENIAMGFSSAEAVVAAWMASPTHRANILNGSYGQIGVGYVANGGYWAQWFTN